MKQPMLGISGMFDPQLIQIAGPAADGTIVGTPKSQTNPKLDAMQKAYTAKAYAEPESPYTKYAYDATGILLQSLKTAGTKDKAAIAKTIRAISYDGVTGKVTFDANGQTQVPVELQLHEVKDGKWVSR